MDRDLHPGRGVVIPAGAVRWRFTASGGPGGQHANRSNTKVEAVVDLTEVDVDPDLRARLVGRLGAEVRVTVDDTRSQTRNRELALDRLEQRLASALTTPRRRRATKPSRAAKRRRVDAKRRRGQVKRGRGKPSVDD